MKSKWTHPDLRARLEAKHGARTPRGYGLLLREGWYSLADRLLTEAANRYPFLTIYGLRGYGGWLRIQHHVPLETGVMERAEIEKFLQGYVTESTWTCEECGSHRGEHWHANRAGVGYVSTHYDRVICPTCRPEFEREFREATPAIILKTMPLTPFTLSH